MSIQNVTILIHQHQRIVMMDTSREVTTRQTLEAVVVEMNISVKLKSHDIQAAPMELHQQVASKINIRHRHRIIEQVAAVTVMMIDR